jgi:multidrug resistance efflux pump
VNVEETRITQVSIGQKVDVKIDAYPGSTFEGTVTEIGSTTQTYFSATSSFTTSGTYTKVTQNIPVKVEISNPDGLPLIFGMNATVKFYVK